VIDPRLGVHARVSRSLASNLVIAAAVDPDPSRYIAPISAEPYRRARGQLDIPSRGGTIHPIRCRRETEPLRETLWCPQVAIAFGADGTIQSEESLFPRTRADRTSDRAVPDPCLEGIHSSNISRYQAREPLRTENIELFERTSVSTLCSVDSESDRTPPVHGRSDVCRETPTACLGDVGTDEPRHRAAVLRAPGSGPNGSLLRAPRGRDHDPYIATERRYCGRFRVCTPLPDTETAETDRTTASPT